MLMKRLERGLNLRKFEVGNFGSWRLAAGLTIFLIVTKATGATESDFLCCPGSEISIFQYTNCTDGTPVRLDCKGNDYYGLRPSLTEIEEFIIVDRGEMRLETNHPDFLRSVDRFCTSGENDTERLAFICTGKLDPDDLQKIMIIRVLSIVSGIFFALTLAVYVVLPELRSVQDKSTASLVGFLGLAYFILSIQQFRTPRPGEDPICVPLAFAMYWSFLSAFFWMNLVSFNVWRSVWFKNFPIHDKNLFRGFCAIAFVGPSLMVIFTLVSHYADGDHLKPGFGVQGCWFNGNSATWAYFYGPIAILLSFNVVYMGLTCWRLWMVNKSRTGGKLKSLRCNCLLYAKLVFVMGITWIFEVAAASFAPSGFSPWFITDVLNCLQGFIMFVLLIATRRRVKKLLARKKLCGLSFPKSWMAYDENEEDSSVHHVDVELSNSP